MQIPFIGRFLSKNDDDNPKLGSQKNINHNTKAIVRHLGGLAHENHLITVQICNPDGSVNKKAGVAHSGIITLDEKKRTIAFDQFSLWNYKQKVINKITPKLVFLSST